MSGGLISAPGQEGCAAPVQLLELYNRVPGAVFRCLEDEEFTVAGANDGLFEFLGCTREEFAALGSRLSAVSTPGDLAGLAAAVKAQRGRGGVLRGETRLLCRDGTARWVSIKARHVVEEDGRACLYCVFVDITEEKQLQEQMRARSMKRNWRISPSSPRRRAAFRAASI